MRRRRVKQGDPSLAIAYVRVSTEDQNLGPEAQRDEILAWARRSGVTVVAWREDRLSGSTPAERRDGLLEALADLRSFGAGLLVAAKRDRLARDVVVAATLERLAEDAGARVVTADGVSAEDTPEGALMRTLLDAFSAYERARIRARIKAAMGVKRKRGEFLGEAPLGHVRGLDGIHLQEHREEQTAVARIKELRAQGYTIRQIRDRLNAEGIPARGTRWHHTSVWRVLQRGEAA